MLTGTAKVFSYGLDIAWMAEVSQRATIDALDRLGKRRSTGTGA